MLYFPHRQYKDIIGTYPDVRSSFLSKYAYFDKQAVEGCYTSRSIDYALRAIRLSSLPDFCDTISDEHNSPVENSPQVALELHSYLADMNININIHEHIASNNSNLVNHIDDYEWHSVTTGVYSSEIGAM